MERTVGGVNRRFPPHPQAAAEARRPYDPQPLPKDITQADKILQGRDQHTGTHNTATLRRPLHPGTNEPSYYSKTVEQGSSTDACSHQISHDA
ncbi:hypothetical protein M1P56_16305 [Streptomyces sp. HU2014]|uniref:hypothetical protein n=1 Tax=Streptomyces sp. HU2014 TaxID=2939414 RepID=UPI00200F808E|nr:hypothetical protein [Streptomyces sp. HU2014]UQI45806.1 hypothetical protein M1P56_16305 [Streptomyces sp. HU2014]